MKRRGKGSDRLGYLLFLFFIFLVCSIFLRAKERQAPTLVIQDAAREPSVSMEAAIPTMNELPLAKDSTTRVGIPSQAEETGAIGNQMVKSDVREPLSADYTGSMRLEIRIMDKAFSIPAKLSVRSWEAGRITYYFSAKGKIDYKMDKTGAVIPVYYDLRGDLAGTIKDGAINADGSVSNILSADINPIYAALMSQELREKLNTVTKGSGHAEGVLRSGRMEGSIGVDAGGYRAEGSWQAE